MAEKKKENPVLGLVMLAVIGFFLYWYFSGPSETPEEKAVRSQQEAAQKAEEKRKGFHCLSAWDGSHLEFKRAVKKMMRDPDSFEHVETRVTPVSPEGTHTIIMKYRAKNGFGGMNVGTALGTFKNSDCTFTVLSVE